MQKSRGLEGPQAVARRPEGRLLLIFDGRCGYYRGLVRWLLSLKGAEAVRAVSIHELIAPGHAVPSGLTLQRCRDRLHLVGGDRTCAGFYTIRRLAWELWPLQIFLPFLYLPGLGVAGRLVGYCLSKCGRRCLRDGDPTLPYHSQLGPGRFPTRGRDRF